MMPHPDRAWDKKLGSEDGKLLFASMINAIADTAEIRRKENGKISV